MRIGKDECVMSSVASSIINCVPPRTQPEPLSTSAAGRGKQNQLPEVIVSHFKFTRFRFLARDGVKVVTACIYTTKVEIICNNIWRMIRRFNHLQTRI